MVSSGRKALLIMSCFDFLMHSSEAARIQQRIHFANETEAAGPSSAELCCAKGEHGSFTSFKSKSTCKAGKWNAGHEHEVDKACCPSGKTGAIPVSNSPCNKKARIPGAPCPGSAAAAWRNAEGKNLVCCCRSSAPSAGDGQDPALSCQGDAKGDNAPYIFHPAITREQLLQKPWLKEQTPVVLGVSQTCHLKSFCCHTFQGTHCKAATADTFTEERKQYNTDADASLCFPPPPTPQQPTPDLLDKGNTADPLDKGNTPEFLKTLAAKPNQHNGASKAHLSGRDYTIIIDRSGSMGVGDNVAVPDKMAEKLHTKKGSQTMTRWKQVEGALEFLAPFVAAEDPDGVSLYFFSSDFLDLHCG